MLKLEFSIIFLFQNLVLFLAIKNKLNFKKKIKIIKQNTIYIYRKFILKFIYYANKI